MKRFVLSILLFSALASGQEIVRGPISNALTYTTASVALFVDPTGSDNNACTSTGTAACLTIQGAFNKIPKVLRHRATVTLAAGSYAGAIISGFTIDPAFQKTTAGILLDGALANVTPATGSATGTATSGTAGSGSTFGTLIDSGATWTVNDPAIVGKLVVITGGTGSGQVKAIVSNTATSISIAGTWTAPTGTSTYALQSPSTNITSAAPLVPSATGATVMAAASLQIADNVMGASRITIRNIGITLSASTTGVFVTGSPVEFVQDVIGGGANGAGIRFDVGSVGSITNCSIASGSSIAVDVLNFASADVISTRILTSTTGVNASGFKSVARVGGAQLTSLIGMAAANNATISLLSVGNRCDCSSTANSACLVAGGSNNSTAFATTGISIPGYITVATNLDVTNCTVGLLATGTSTIGTGSAVVVSGNGLTYGANAIEGGAIVLPTATTTITGGTAEMSVDTGAATGTWSSLAASGNCLNNLSTTSRICRL